MRHLVKLKDIATHSKGSQINGDELKDDAEFDYLNGGINPSGKWNEANCVANTITISEGGNSCGYVNFMRKPFWCGAHCYYLYDTVDNTQYLYYALKSPQDRIMKLRSGACMPNIKKGDLGNFEFCFDDDEDEQKNAVQVLSKLEYVIDARKKELFYLDNLIEARFVEMFGDPVLNDKKFSTLSGEDFFKLSNGKAVPEEKRHEVGIPAYGGNGISWYTNEVLRVEDTLVVGRVGFQSGNVHYAVGPLWITDNAMYISQYDKGKINLVFLCELMQRVNFSRFQDAGDLKKITQKPFMSFQYILPSMELQQKFVDFKEQIDKSKVAVQKALDETQTLFDSLMQKCFE